MKLSLSIAGHVATLLVLSLSTAGAGLSEDERMEEYHARGHTWPPKYVPETEGWQRINDRRFSQMRMLEESNPRYNGYVETSRSAITTPNFTENGWGLARAPEDLAEELRKAIRDGMKNRRSEHSVDVIDGPPAWFIDRPDLTKRTLEELLPMHEQWAGIELVGNNAYGLRLYRNESVLHMHVDKPDTHIISCILHIGRSEDSEPWPIVIEDLQGNTNEVYLESGDILFYESSKCFHGRPTKFIGTWYSSIFVHYYPKGWDKPKRRMDAHYAVPPHWSDQPEAKTATATASECNDKYGDCGDWAKQRECLKNPAWMAKNCRRSCGTCSSEAAKDLADNDEYVHIDRLEMVGTGLKEPDCEHGWCGMRNAVKWFGPGEDGMVITTNKKYPLWPEKDEL
mmetsp:Transcript_29623/g.60485  ORF Transcript_29623/g.60485 Transcript_29623/m.60485 type:complete len:397 (-) Transcript_29623:155-1345(-)|eukprot:CAMPEP_0183325906 /NCGR_PEP_ID=MMETSP0160_2-20130417/80829_1 /TAXON_ID=2839 ORGANISM="Odontella Sinensis, Strain Grunow 1884" /NCGR_SAMPLE_ID=MMETSP0160_2 /ASSEMBLY_ACC=CAM_ASM_000250 /LENGTH=396 /DNA_ID=CAMNT_0025493793 /DNA_START=13 /DNA_END=1203 /DNA_ORIENTATION=+